MTTSGTYVFDATADQVITSAFRGLGRLSEEQVLTDLPAAMQANGQFKLNILLKMLAAQGMPVWQMTTVNIPYNQFTGYSVNVGPGLTVNIPAPLKVTQGQSFSTSTSSSVDMTVMTQYDYVELVNTAHSIGVPVNLYYQPLNGSGMLSVWPSPDPVTALTGSITITYQRQTQDLGSGNNTLDYPPYWTAAIIAGLTYMMAGEYATPIADKGSMRQDYQYLLDQALSFGTEEGSFRFEPEWNRG